MGEDMITEQHTTIKQITGEGEEDGGCNSDDGDDYDGDNNNALERTLPQTERKTGANICPLQ
jgi:hypothetical protein